MTGAQRGQSDPPRTPANEWTPKMVMDWLAAAHDEVAHRASEAAVWLLDNYRECAAYDAAQLLQLSVEAGQIARRTRNGSGSGFLVDIGVTELPR